MAQTERFCNAQLFGYINDISKEEQSQFSVVCVRLDDKSIYVSFSGTDNTIVGWRENFNMGYLSETPGQLKAVDYPESYRERGLGKIRVGDIPRVEIFPYTHPSNVTGISRRGS